MLPRICQILIIAILISFIVLFELAWTVVEAAVVAEVGNIEVDCRVVGCIFGG